MPDTRLILHVKGTESGTTELPKDEVKAAISEGKISQSQLIWSPKDNAWKQVKEIPELMPGETMILHVKGTEAETKELPKKAIRAAVSKGDMTMSQLIWSPKDTAWKQVRELPELLPGETLILHVKGTEAQTQELPKEAVRSAIAQGKITQSQLIWNAAESAWKQVREWPDLAPGETLILHVKGTEAETTQLPKKAVRVGISKGDITHSQLIWSASENQWKQVRQMPELLPSQKLAPAPARSATPPRVLDGIMPDTPQNPVARAASNVQAPPRVKVSVGQPRVAEAAEASAQPRIVPVAASAQPRVAVAATAVPHVRVATPETVAPQVRVAAAEPVVPQVRVVPAEAAVPQIRVAAAESVAPQVRVATSEPAVPQVRVAAAAEPQVRAMPVAAAGAPTVRTASASPNRSHVVKSDDGPHFLKWICFGLGGLIGLVILVNYFLVDRALQSNFRETSYSDCTVYGHYGAFIQPNVIVIHIPASKKITPQNITDFLVELAHSTPDNPVSGDLFNRVALTSGWTAQYSFSGYSWKQLGDMSKENSAQREEFIMSQMGDAAGESVMPESTLNQSAQEEKRERVWNAFVAHFVTQP